MLRSTIEFPKPSQTTEVFTKVCLFCNQARKRIKDKEQGLSNFESKNFNQNIRKYIEWQDDQIFSVCLRNFVFSEREMRYHGIYKLGYQTAAEVTMKYTLREKLKFSINGFFS